MGILGDRNRGGVIVLNRTSNKVCGEENYNDFLGNLHGSPLRKLVTSQGTLASAVRRTAENSRFGEKKDLRAEDLYRVAPGWLETRGTSAWQSAAGSLD